MEKTSKLQISAIFKIPEGKIEEFKQQANECIKLSKEKDPGTLRYDWFISSDQSECEIREEYKDSEAVIQHMMNLGPILTKLSAEFPMESLTVYGDPSPQLLEMSKGFNAKLYSLL
ncbi:MAG: putative quinol monooxygenase [Promethearchaeota archaeon]|jgi:quinol monooxygenase YgiN